MNMEFGATKKESVLSFPKKMRDGFVSGFQNFLGPEMRSGAAFDKRVGKKELLNFREDGILSEKWKDLVLGKDGGAEFLARYQNKLMPVLKKDLPSKEPPQPKVGNHAEKMLVPRERTKEILLKIRELLEISDHALFASLKLNPKTLDRMYRGVQRLHIAQVRYLGEVYWHSVDDFFEKLGLGLLISNDTNAASKTCGVATEEKIVPEKRGPSPSSTRNYALKREASREKTKAPETCEKTETIVLDLDGRDLTRIHQAIQCGLVATGEVHINIRLGFFVGFLAAELDSFSPALSQDGQSINFYFGEETIAISIGHIKKLFSN